MICLIVGGVPIPESSLMTRLKLTLILCLAFLIPGLVAPALATNQIQLNSKPPVKIDVKTYPSKVADRPGGLGCREYCLGSRLAYLW